MGHLPQEQFSQAKQLLSEYKDVFSIWNSHISRTKNSNFDIDTRHLAHIADPLRRVPLHMSTLLKQLLPNMKI